MSGFLKGFGMLLAYFLICAAGTLGLRKMVALPTEVFRKMLHLILLGSVMVWLYAFSAWWISAAALLAFIALVYPLLSAAEKIPGFSDLLTERAPGELKRSLVLVFLMFAVLIAVCWGWLGERYLVLASVLAWGLGDAAAALIGTRYGSHIIRLRCTDGKKSVEGTLAMGAVSFVSVFGVLAAYGALQPQAYVPVSAAVAVVCAAVELVSRNGFDTVSCPLAAAALLIPLVQVWGVKG